VDQLPATSYQRLTPSRGRVLTSILGIAALIGIAREGSAQLLTEQTRYTTHDWTLPTGLDYREFWADVKTPGDGYAYVLGTIEVRDTQLGAQFSQQAADAFLGTEFSLFPGAVRQVVMLQKVDTTTQLNAPQKFFCGTSPLSIANLRSTNARGISVWPAATEGDTRVVICGETYDQNLPLSQDPNVGFAAANGTNATGFVAVYDGALRLLWTHHFFGTRETGECAVTDISVRVVEVEGGSRDVVTYCGISTFGSPAGANASLTPVQPFGAPAAALQCAGSSRAWANGSTDNGPGQWDGFVGRISRDHNGSGITTTEFHSVVGGAQQDGLFGISELEGNQFAVCGSTSGTSPSTGLASPGVCVTSSSVYCLGTVFVFDATPVASGNPLRLDSSLTIGQPGELHTIARDIIAQPNAQTAFGQNTLMVVGSTEDADLLGNYLGQQTAFSGPTDGFLTPVGHIPSVAQVPGGGSLNPIAVEYQGLDGNSGYMGVNSWNEFADHAAVVGFVEQSPLTGTSDIDVASYYLYTGGYVDPSTPLTMRLLTRGQLEGSSDDRPTAMGLQEVTQNGASIVFQTFGLGNPAGGGITQDASGRVQVVGATTSLDFQASVPLTRTGRPRSTNLVPPGVATIHDGVRVALDLLPFHVGRTDGTGTPPSLSGLTFPRAGTDGGTTPTCDIKPFGAQIGLAAPAQRRMLIAYDGPTPSGGSSAGIVVSRTPAAGAFVFAALQIGFPGDLANMPVMLNGLEAWVPYFMSSQYFLANPNSTFHTVIPTLPSTGQFTIQVAFGVLNPVTSGNVAAGVPCTVLDYVIGTPGMYLDY
jgi:hypothetical protein